MSAETTKAPSLETQVAEWSATESDLREAVKATEGITVAGHTEGPKRGAEAVHDAMMKLINLRTPIEKRRMELKRPILDLGNLVDSEAKRLTAILEPREAELRADRDAYRSEQAKIAAEKKAKEDRLAAIAAEEARAILQAKVERVTALGGIPNLAQLQLISDEAFDALCSELAEVQAAKIAREAQEKADRDEEDRAAAERKRLQDIEDTRLEKERAELRREREAQEAERKRLDAEADKIRREREEEESRDRREQERKEAEAEAERERIEAAERETAEAARIEAEKPEREQIAAWAKAWAGAEPKHPQIASKVLRANLERTSEDILRLLNLLTGAEGGGE
jgi:hypothetical protein